MNNDHRQRESEFDRELANKAELAHKSTQEHIAEVSSLRLRIQALESESARESSLQEAITRLHQELESLRDEGEQTAQQLESRSEEVSRLTSQYEKSQDKVRKMQEEQRREHEKLISLRIDYGHLQRQHEQDDVRMAEVGEQLQKIREVHASEHVALELTRQQLRDATLEHERLDGELTKTQADLRKAQADHIELQ